MTQFERSGQDVPVPRTWDVAEVETAANSDGNADCSNAANVRNYTYVALIGDVQGNDVPQENFYDEVTAPHGADDEEIEILEAFPSLETLFPEKLTIDNETGETFFPLAGSFVPFFESYVKILDTYENDTSTIAFKNVLIIKFLSRLTQAQGAGELFGLDDSELLELVERAKTANKSTLIIPELIRASLKNFLERYIAFLET